MGLFTFLHTVRVLILEESAFWIELTPQLNSFRTSNFPYVGP